MFLEQAKRTCLELDERRVIDRLLRHDFRLDLLELRVERLRLGRRRTLLDDVIRLVRIDLQIHVLDLEVVGAY